ncbi:DUF305 domain-containing protein [Phycicoccus sp. MAQZ13P-2]|uniref:DUF305 domain-containing protein n=1 Tax=Phycicoccus mangrovi TaxID=2840470 RepID=UPI001BFFF92F|nr:DUF305 domain-containing protein [Phycicoccus mangrovi]MBT9256808.1 DUF305 domain-containing protein [Phycicoccus mangrovi]MBT9275043.1 DUF305 domain-containing protein [Phycicoccus mangrovi]
MLPAPTARPGRLLTGLVVAVALLGGCSSGGGERTSGALSAPAPAAVPGGVADGTADAGEPTTASPQDATLARSLVAQQAQAVVLVDTVREVDSPAVARFVADVRAERLRELEDTAEWLRARGEKVPPEVEDPRRVAHDGAGTAAALVSGTQLEHLAAARGSDADRLLLGLLMTHHEKALALLEGRPASADAELEALLGGIRETRQEQLRRIDDLFVTLTD